MKRQGLLMLMLIIMVTLTACAGNDSTAERSEPSAQPANRDGTQAETEEPVRDDSANPVDAASISLATEPPVDLDLTGLSGTVVYSQVYDMMVEPENYMGQKIKMKGSFSYFQDPDTKQEYFAAIIADATACCAQGIEFVWKGDHTYPQDYPPLDTEITVTGTFSTYYEGDYMYVQLVDADVDWYSGHV